MPQAIKPSRACYWLIGARNTRQAPAVAIDLHADDGELANPGGETMTFRLTNDRRHMRRNARAKAKRYAVKHGIAPAAMNYDPDSTACFADC